MSSLLSYVIDKTFYLAESMLAYLVSSTMYIYCLRDPRDLKIRYVGRTRNLKRRLKQHINDGDQFLKQFGGKLPPGRKQTKITWIAELLHLKLKPRMEVLEAFDLRYKNPDDVERKWIRHYQKQQPLYNILMKERNNKP